MKISLILLVACACLFSKLEGQSVGAPIPILRQENVNNGDGSYHYSFETGDGIKQEQRGELKDQGNGPALSVTGSYSYTDPSGKLISVSYSADEFGYHPVTTIQQNPKPQTNSGYLPPADNGYKY